MESEVCCYGFTMNIRSQFIRKLAVDFNQIHEHQLTLNTAPQIRQLSSTEPDPSRIVGMTDYGKFDGIAASLDRDVCDSQCTHARTVLGSGFCVRSGAEEGRAVVQD